MTSGLGLASMVLPLGSKVLRGMRPHFGWGNPAPLNSEIMLLEWIVVYIFLTWIQITILGVICLLFFQDYFFRQLSEMTVSNCLCQLGTYCNVCLLEKKSVQIWTLGATLGKELLRRFGLVGKWGSYTKAPGPEKKQHPIVLISLLRISAKHFWLLGWFFCWLFRRFHCHWT